MGVSDRQIVGNGVGIGAGIGCGFGLGWGFGGVFFSNVAFHQLTFSRKGVT